MGKYINEIEGVIMGPDFESKCLIIAMNGGKKTEAKEFEENLVCVVDNGPFAAAAYAYSKSEWEVFSAVDNRKKQWYVLPNAEKYAG